MSRLSGMGENIWAEFPADIENHYRYRYRHRYFFFGKKWRFRKFFVTLQAER